MEFVQLAVIAGLTDFGLFRDKLSRKRVTLVGVQFLGARNQTVSYAERLLRSNFSFEIGSESTIVPFAVIAWFWIAWMI